MENEKMTFEFDAEKYKKASAHQRQQGKKLIAELDLKGDESHGRLFLFGI